MKSNGNNLSLPYLKSHQHGSTDRFLLKIFSSLASMTPAPGFLPSSFLKRCSYKDLIPALLFFFNPNLSLGNLILDHGIYHVCVDDSHI